MKKLLTAIAVATLFVGSVSANAYTGKDDDLIGPSLTGSVSQTEQCSTPSPTTQPITVFGDINVPKEPTVETITYENKESDLFYHTKDEFVQNGYVREHLIDASTDARLKAKQLKVMLRFILKKVTVGVEGGVGGVDREPDAGEVAQLQRLLGSITADTAEIQKLTKSAELPYWVDANPKGEMTMFGKVYPPLNAKVKKAYAEMTEISKAANVLSAATSNVCASGACREILNESIPLLYEQTGKLQSDSIIIETDRTMQQFYGTEY